MKVTHLDLFSGIGGFALACQWAGIETIGFVEIDKYCQKVLRKHWPNVPIVEDIRDVEKIKEIVQNTRCQYGERQLLEKEHEKALSKGATTTHKRPDSTSRTCVPAEGRTEPPAILITAGFPCQPFSVAGKQLSQGDDRYLWPQTFAVIEAVKPKWVLLENVTGIINLALDTVLSDLEGAGYSYETLIIPACAVNAWHRRDRIWIVGYSQSNGQRPSRDTSSYQIQQKNRTNLTEIRCGEVSTSLSQSRESWQQTEQEGGQGSGRGSEEINMANTRGDSMALNGQQGQSETECGNGRRISPNDSREFWAVEPELCLLADGLSQELDGGINGRTINVSKDSTQIHWGEVRRMWLDCLSRPSSHGWRQDEQLARELADILRCVSYPLALEKWEEALATTFGYLYRVRKACEAIGALRNPSVTVDEAWQSLSQEDKDWVIMASARGQWVAEWPGILRVSTGVKNRVDRLKCLGNAIVPQVAYQILKVIAEIES